MRWSDREVTGCQKMSGTVPASLSVVTMVVGKAELPSAQLTHSDQSAGAGMVAVPVAVLNAL